VTPDGSTILFLGGLHPLGKQIIVDLDDQTLYACDGLKRIYTFDCTSGDEDHQSHAVWLTSAFKKWGMDYFGSHGCVRLAEDDAQTLFAWAVPQTPVFIDLSRKSFR